MRVRFALAAEQRRRERRRDRADARAMV